MNTKDLLQGYNLGQFWVNFGTGLFFMMYSTSLKVIFFINFSSMRTKDATTLIKE